MRPSYLQQHRALPLGCPSLSLQDFFNERVWRSNRAQLFFVAASVPLWEEGPVCLAVI